jgi:hypothetical protein
MAMSGYARLLWSLSLTFALGLTARAAKDCYVVGRSGEKVRGERLTAEKDGTLKLQLSAGGPTQTFKPGAYAYAFVPKPEHVGNLEKAYLAGKYELVEKHGTAIFEKYKFLGWGDHISYLEGMVLIDRKDYAGAKRVFERGQKFQVKHGEELVKGMVLALLGLKETDQVKPMLDKMLKAADEQTAAFAFNVRGRILADEGKTKEAVLEYLKTVLLFKPGVAVADRERREAKQKVVALLEELKDPRAKEFEKLD